jgi:predicted transcriptional regulator
MNITFNELRKVKHQLPTGSVKRIAEQLGLEEQTVRNYFGAKKYQNGQVVDAHVQPGPDGGIVHLEDTSILDLAKRMIQQTNQN